jgi:transcriptional regulator with XRE-family HTH domain
MLCNASPLEITETGRKEFGARLKAYRQHHKMTLREAEAFIGDRCCGRTVSFNSLSAIERGHRDIDTATLLLFAQSGYGDMTFSEMGDILTDRRLAVCESGGRYNA